MNKFEELLVNRGLYKSIEVTIDDLEELEKLLSGGIYNGYNIDCYCVHCGEKRIFETVDNQVYDERGFIRVDIDTKSGKKTKKETIYQGYLNKRYSISFRCTRNNSHSLLFDLLINNEGMMKIGQYPTFADISVGDTTKYKSVLGNKYGEYKKALGLCSHGIGIGSFVYLRRIIESLVFEKFDEVSSEIEIDRKSFLQSKFEEKIAILSDYLPKILVEKKNIYGIVSKGIHELDESECVDMFPYIKVGIDMILDDILAEKDKKEKEKMFSSFVDNKTGEFKKKS